MRGGSSFDEFDEPDYYHKDVKQATLDKINRVPSDMILDIKKVADELSPYITAQISIMKHPAKEDILSAFEHLVRAMDDLHSYVFYQDGYEVKEEEDEA